MHGDININIAPVKENDIIYWEVTAFKEPNSNQNSSLNISFIPYRR